MTNKDQVIQGLLDSHKSFWDTAIKIPNPEISNNDKWSVCQTVEHINIALVRLDIFLTLPKDTIYSQYGASNNGSASFEEFNEICTNTFSKKIKATEGFIPQLEISYDINTLIFKGIELLEKLIINLKNWSEEDLDLYNCPHPVFGKTTVREILYFSIFHANHHNQTIKKTS